jgi:hypothetical protein
MNPNFPPVHAALAAEMLAKANESLLQTEVTSTQTEAKPATSGQ